MPKMPRTITYPLTITISPDADDLADLTTQMQARAALEAARHALTTLHGLWAYDGAAPAEVWQLDERAVLAQLDAVLGPPPGLRMPPTQEGP